MVNFSLLNGEVLNVSLILCFLGFIGSFMFKNIVMVCLSVNGILFDVLSLLNDIICLGFI